MKQEIGWRLCGPKNTNTDQASRRPVSADRIVGQGRAVKMRQVTRTSNKKATRFCKVRSKAKLKHSVAAGVHYRYSDGTDGRQLEQTPVPLQARQTNREPVSAGSNRGSNPVALHLVQQRVSWHVAHSGTAGDGAGPSMFLIISVNNRKCWRWSAGIGKRTSSAWRIALQARYACKIP